MVQNNPKSVQLKNRQLVTKTSSSSQTSAFQNDPIKLKISQTKYISLNNTSDLITLLNNTIQSQIHKHGVAIKV